MQRSGGTRGSRALCDNFWIRESGPGEGRFGRKIHSPNFPDERSEGEGRVGWGPFGRRPPPDTLAGLGGGVGGGLTVTFLEITILGGVMSNA